MAIKTHRVESGRDLRKWRERRGWTQYQAAIWYGVTETTWKKLETAAAIPLPLRQRVAEIAFQERLLKLATPRPV